MWVSSWKPDLYKIKFYEKEYSENDIGGGFRMRRRIHRLPRADRRSGTVRPGSGECGGAGER